MNTLRLTNPHSILAALQHRPEDVLEIHANPAKANDAWQAVIELAKPHRIPVRQPLPPSSRGKKPSRDGGRIGTTFAVVKEKPGVSLEALLSTGVSRGLWIALDHIQDPHNVGAIFRAASFFGIQGIITTIDRSAPLTATVYDVASGGLEDVPFVLQTNLSNAIEAAKKQGLWVLGTSEHAEQSMRDVDRDRKWLLVLGNEEKGIRQLTEKRCDEVCAIPSQGAVTSLNVSVAAGVLMSSLVQP
ncbi:MAG: 23S rRNA (guanosine(2251)-2'-O)-methyltransferase RlmB [Planctomycetaceae bacterium]|nr:23S rRNA (guanosine(2251)-2'-O)-methyltransferase RlmB [Planctomycetaceae bacterium]